MARKSRRDWLFEGARILTEHGADALTIEALTQRLGVTKGSFYHHFRGMPDFIDALLEFYETEGTLDVIAATEAAPDARGKLRALLKITTTAPADVEVGFRAWALRDERVRAVQERIDTRRIDYLTGLCAALSPAHGADVAQILYLIYVGSQRVIPTPDTVTIQRLYRNVLRAYMPDIYPDEGA